MVSATTYDCFAAAATLQHIWGIRVLMGVVINSLVQHYTEDCTKSLRCFYYRPFRPFHKDHSGHSDWQTGPL